MKTDQFFPFILAISEGEGMPVIVVITLVVVIMLLFFKRSLSMSTNAFSFSPGINPFASYRMPPAGMRILGETFIFFRKARPRHQRQFGRRVMRFIAQKNFEGRDKLDISFKMKVLIAAAAVRVTWGLRTFDFPSFHTIIVYPRRFYSGFSKAVVKGETNMAGVIVFSWEDFLFGISDQNDNLNLGYHEFGHALFIERFRETIDGRFERNYDRWRRLIFNEGKLKEAELKGTFREYATFNEHEFFAVAVENFFERPEKFSKDLPKLYRLMVLMMNQDPLAIDQPSGWR